MGLAARITMIVVIARMAGLLNQNKFSQMTTSRANGCFS
jgi:hypothetical protein